MSESNKENHFPWGALLGDIVGSVYEHDAIKSTEFPLFSEACRVTDDTVLTIATAEALLDKNLNFSAAYQKWAQRYPNAGYGGTFSYWMKLKKPRPYDSFGNGSAMRVAPVGYFANTVEEVLELAKRSAEVTHNHPEGIKGAQAVALAVFMARHKWPVMDIGGELSWRFGYDLKRTVESIRTGYSFDVTCQGSVPESIICFLEADSCEVAIRNAVSLGGDADTMACIAGAIAGAMYGVPLGMVNEVEMQLDPSMRKVVNDFAQVVKD